MMQADMAEEVGRRKIHTQGKAGLVCLSDRRGDGKRKTKGGCVENVVIRAPEDKKKGWLFEENDIKTKSKRTKKLVRLYKTGYVTIGGYWVGIQKSIRKL